MLRGRDIYGPGFWKGGAGGPGYGGPGFGGRGGFQSSNCRLYPWLPRRWWAYAPLAAGVAGLAAWGPWRQARQGGPLDEASILGLRADSLRAELSEVEKRLSEMGRDDDDKKAGAGK
ncbi:MAG: hypothetical protein ACM3X4_09735 [Ignavibacteriales bacterium]